VTIFTNNLKFTANVLLAFRPTHNIINIDVTVVNVEENKTIIIECNLLRLVQFTERANLLR